MKLKKVAVIHIILKNKIVLVIVIVKFKLMVECINLHLVID